MQQSNLLQSHGYQADCVCPVCAEHRVETKYSFVHDYIDWANAPLIAGLGRVERTRVAGLDIPLPIWKQAGLRVTKYTQNPSSVFRVGADARA